MAGRTLRCELSWSVSRAREFRRCRREAWYARYGTWAWWQEEPRGERWRLMVLKNLTSLPAFAGDCLHRGIAAWFEQRRDADRTPDARWLFERVRDFFRDGWRDSAQGTWKVKPNQRVHLHEHHYGPAPSRERTDAVRDLLERASTFFVENRALAPAREAPSETWLGLEQLDTFELAGVRVYAVPDYAHRDGARVHIWDWKSGRPRDEDLFQLHAYALYAREKWDADPGAVTVHAAYLGAGEVRTVEVDPDHLGEVEAVIQAGIAELRAVHYDPDHEPPEMDLWPPEPESRKCGDCRFHEVCEASAV